MEMKKRDVLGSQVGVESWREMKEYVGLTEMDSLLLSRLYSLAVPHFPMVVDEFYEIIQQFPDARRVLQSEKQVSRLKKLLITWLSELLLGPHDEAYYFRRRQIGIVHVRVGLPDRYMFTAMNRIREHLTRIAKTTVEEDLWDTVIALTKVIDLDLALMTSAYMDSHEQRELMGLQNMILNHLPMMVICVGTAGKISSSTHEFRRRFGVFHSIYDQGFPSHFIDPKIIEHVLVEKERLLSNLTVFDRGQEFRMRMAVIPIQHQSVGSLIFLEDLTEEMDLQYRTQHAESLAKIGRMAAGLAHEIRNPLAGISASLQVIESSLPPDDDRIHVLQRVQGQTHRLNDLVTDLLLYARPYSAVLEDILLAGIVQDAISESGVHVKLEIFDESIVRTDPAATRQIIVNLVRNAAEACEKNGAIIVQVGPGGRVIVADTGQGLSEESRSSLFEPFYTTKATGTGLGLSISQKLAETIGGSLSLCPEKEAGTLMVEALGACFLLELVPVEP
jgi:signal transduction histidine kinase